jgi:hypothetical protein
VTALMLEWTGPGGGTIGIGFDDAHFGTGRRRAEIDLARRAYPSLPNEVPPGTIFAFGREATGHLKARFRVVPPSIGAVASATCAGCGRRWA